MKVFDLGDLGIAVELDEETAEMLEKLNDILLAIATNIHEKVCTEDTPDSMCANMVLRNKLTIMSGIKAKASIDDIADAVIKNDFIMRLAENAQYN